MKTLQVYLYVTAIVAVSSLLFGQETSAQSVESAEPGQTVDCSKSRLAGLDGPESRTLFEEDYPYLTQVHCLKNGYFNGWNIKRININQKTPTHYVLLGNGLGINVHATYDEEGRLLAAVLRKEDIPLPPLILNHLHQNFNGWAITGNEKIVIDFDPGKTLYKVFLKNENSEQIVHFDRDGNRVVLFSDLETCFETSFQAL